MDQHLKMARRAGSDGSMYASGSAGHLKIFNLGARRGGDVHFLHHRPGLNSKPFRSIYVEKAYSRPTVDSDPSDGDVKPGGPLGAYR